MTYSMKDGERPAIAVPELWLTSSIRRSVEHVLDSHYSAVHMHGIRIIIIGPGAPDLFHVKIVNSFGTNNGSSVGCDSRAELWNVCARRADASTDGDAS